MEVFIGTCLCISIQKLITKDCLLVNKSGGWVLVHVFSRWQSTWRDEGYPACRFRGSTLPQHHCFESGVRVCFPHDDQEAKKERRDQGPSILFKATPPVTWLPSTKLSLLEVLGAPLAVCWAFNTLPHLLYMCIFVQYCLMLFRLVIGRGWKSFIKDWSIRSGRGRRKAKSTGIRRLFFPSSYTTGTWPLFIFILRKWVLV